MQHPPRSTVLQAPVATHGEFPHTLVATYRGLTGLGFPWRSILYWPHRWTLESTLVILNAGAGRAPRPVPTRASSTSPETMSHRPRRDNLTETGRRSER